MQAGSRRRDFRRTTSLDSSVRGILITSILALASISPPASAVDCLKANQDGQVVEGRLERRGITDEAYKRTETAYLLYPAKSVCLDGEDYDRVEGATRIHVFSMDAAIRKKLEANVGKRVRVTGSAFGEHTAHHHAPIVMNIVEAVRLR
jgi:hypothetical protein